MVTTRLNSTTRPGQHPISTTSHHVKIPNARSTSDSPRRVTFKHEYNTSPRHPPTCAKRPALAPYQRPQYTGQHSLVTAPFTQRVCTCVFSPPTHTITSGIIHIRPVSGRSVYNCVRSKSNVNFCQPISHTLSPPRLISTASNPFPSCLQQLISPFRFSFIFSLETRSLAVHQYQATGTGRQTLFLGAPLLGFTLVPGNWYVFPKTSDFQSLCLHNSTRQLVRGDRNII